MNNNGGDFGSKGSGKPITIFSSKRSNFELPSTERAPSPFHTYMQSAANSSLPRTQELGVSRGIFQRTNYFREEIMPNSARPITNFEEERNISPYYRQIIQDFMNNEFKTQILQFRFEMTQIMDLYLREFGERNGKNQEGLGTIKESVNNQSYHLEQLEHKIEEHHSNISSIRSFMHSEIGSMKQGVSSYKSIDFDGPKLFNAQKMQRIENQQQEILRDFERLKEEVTESLHMTLEEYNQAYDQDGNEKVNKILNEIKSNMEQKIEKVLDHLNGKVAVLEKQIQNYSRSDDPVIDKIKFEMEDKINEHTQTLRNQIENLKWTAGTKTDETNLKTYITNAGLDQRIDQARYELEAIRSELALASERIKQENKDLNIKLSDYERRYNEEYQLLRNNIQSDRNPETVSFDSPTKKMKEDNEKKLSDLERRFEEVKQGQRELNNDISKQKSKLENSKINSSLVENPSLNQSQTEEIQLQRLEEIIDQMNRNVGSLRNNLFLNETNINFNPELFARNNGSPSLLNSSPSTSHFHNLPQGFDRKGYLIHSSNSSPGQIKSTDLDIKNKISPNYSPENNDKQNSNYSSPENRRNYRTKSSNPKVLQEIALLHKENSVSTPKESKNQDFSNAQNLEEEDEIEVVLHIDDDGYLMDDKGNYYYDSKGEKIKLDEGQIEKLRVNNLLEEDN